MKLAFLWFCIIHVAFISAELFTRKDLQTGSSYLTDRRTQASQRTRSYGRPRPLFARRGQYERQRVHVTKPKELPDAPNDLPPPSTVAPKPVKLSCSQLTQSCLPLSGCCDPHASCHCRFFNAICFCRLYKNKT